MLTKYVLPGEKVELQTIEQSILGAASNKKAYTSKIFDILDEEQFEILMPMEQMKMILLPVDGIYDMCFYTKNGLYQSNVRIVDRYKSNNIFILLCELTTPLRKYQRREYYRFSCILEMQARLLDEEELAAADKNQIYYKEGLQTQKGTIVDISGGGVRFVTKEYHYEVGDTIYLTYQLPLKNRMKTYEIAGKVLAMRKIPEKQGEYEHRLQYINIEKTDREEIIRYIFEEERRNRQRRNGS